MSFPRTSRSPYKRWPPKPRRVGTLERAPVTRRIPPVRWSIDGPIEVAAKTTKNISAGERIAMDGAKIIPAGDRVEAAAVVVAVVAAEAAVRSKGESKATPRAKALREAAVASAAEVIDQKARSQKVIESGAGVEIDSQPQSRTTLVRGS